jgi:antitoxin (DNA-binding transcriptional repressor) of toxin-antitoxin stability system
MMICPGIVIGARGIMDTTIAEDELARHLKETLDRVYVRGERVTIDREGHPIAILTPVAAVATWRTLAKLLAAVGFPGDGFADDLAAARAAQPCLELPVWPS